MLSIGGPSIEFTLELNRCTPRCGWTYTIPPLFLKKQRSVLVESLGLWDASLIRVDLLSKARVDLCRGVANEIFALGIQYRGCLWSDLRSSVVLYGASNRCTGSTTDHTSDVLYGFVGVALAWQLLFFAIARQPVRLRPVIPFAVLEKLSFGIGVMVIYRQGRLDHSDLYFGGIDLALAVLFMLAWWRLAPESTPG